MEYITGYTKTLGHVVLEKAKVKDISIALAVCGDMASVNGGDGRLQVSGRDKGALASFFQNEFASGVMKYGEDYLSAAAFGYSLSPAGLSPVIGPGSFFGSGCAGILAAGSSAYVWVTEGSGMCIIRLARVFGKNRFVRCISSYEGGEDVLDLSPGCVICACPECWTSEYVKENEGNLTADGRSTASFPGGIKGTLDDYTALFEPDLILYDEAFDRRLAELKSEGFDGCIAAVAVK